MGNMEPDEYRQQRCPHGWVDATQCEPCRTTIECDALRAENALLRDALRRYIRLYRVDDQAWDVGAETERLMRIELTPNANVTGLAPAHEKTK